jgi:hypothetical protein
MKQTNTMEAHTIHDFTKTTTIRLLDLTIVALSEEL